LPLDPGRHWLEAGITGLARPREWDAVATVAAPGAPGAETVFVALPDGALLVETDPSSLDAQPLADAIDESLERPYRAVAVRRPEIWVVGACAIRTVELADDPAGDDIELVDRPSGIEVRIDSLPAAVSLPDLERLGSARFTAYVVRAHRLRGRTFEVAVEPL
jgi:hypothetical protein